MARFVEKYFASFQYRYHGSDLEIEKKGKGCGRYRVPPDAPTPNDFLEWLSSLQKDGSRLSWYVSRDSLASKDEGVLGHGATLSLSVHSPPAQLEQTQWDQVQLVGKFYDTNDVTYQQGLIRLCRSAHEVFLSQPTRVFLHGFYGCGSRFDLWAIDRSGIYCSKGFHLQDDSAELLPLLLSYQHMNGQELGESHIFETDGAGRCILVKDADNTPKKFYLDKFPTVISQCLVGNGTACYRARNADSDTWNYALKLKWRWAQERPENELLLLAQERRVWGAVSLRCYEELETTANLRRSLRWGSQKRFSDHAQPRGLNSSGLCHVTEETGSFFQNRILTCMITSPLGRPLSGFSSSTELLHVFRDAIKCHQSLYFDARVLHRDISPGNIIIVDDPDKKQPRGVLIDLDSAIDLYEEQDDEAYITGTKPFMAIDVLRNEYHTYRHDLKSFLYVFLWMIITNHAKSPPQGSRLARWSDGDWKELAARKTLDMAPASLAGILEEFDVEFENLKPLAVRLRLLLFPIQEGETQSAGDESEAARKLYEGMITAFEEALTSIDL